MVRASHNRVPCLSFDFIFVVRIAQHFHCVRRSTLQCSFLSVSDVLTFRTDLHLGSLPESTQNALNDAIVTGSSNDVSETMRRVLLHLFTIPSSRDSLLVPEIQLHFVE